MKIAALFLMLTTLMLPLGGAAEESLGYRNNNPGNIVKTSINWEGEVPCADARFECFSTPYYGIRAITKNLIYYREVYGLTTVQEIIHRWAPPQENDTDAYVQAMRIQVGTLGDKFYQRLPRLVQAMMFHENGDHKFTYDFIEEVVHDTTRDSDLVRLDAPRRDDEDVRHEAEARGTEAHADDAGPRSPPERENRDPLDRGQALYMDSPIHSDHSSPLSVRTPEASSVLRPRRSVRVDGVQSRVLVFHRW